MHIYHVPSGAPVAAILRPARTPKGSEVCTVIKHVTKRLGRRWPKTRLVWRGDSSKPKLRTYVSFLYQAGSCGRGRAMSWRGWSAR